ncbi:MAG TPA: polysaccharide biosynthesis C-terminal domain-containing protein [Kofleriaceae bacterium]|nr:polysaccharide biosynthesis C-terminal domain-containing protein [Kofleriaceae bacterium]
MSANLSAVEASRPAGAVARGSILTFAGYAASLARPVAFAIFARVHGAAALAGLFVLWTAVELGARLASLGLDRGLRRWAGDRAAATAGALVVATLAGAVVAGVVIAMLPRLVPLDADALALGRAVVAITLPTYAAASVALRAARGEAQIAMFVLTRSVVEPVLLLVAGLALGAAGHGARPLFLAFLISIAGSSVVAAITAVRAIGGAALARALVQPRRWPLHALVPTSIPLGIADLLQSVQGKLDLVMVGLVTYSGEAIAGYAIASELVSGFTQVRQGYDQVVAPIAAELRGRRGDLISLLTDGMRWNAAIALAMAGALIAFPATFLDLLGGSAAAVPVLLLLVVGRAIETMLGPATSILSVVGHPRFALAATAIGVAVSVVAQLVLAVFGAAGIAAASSLGAITAALLAAGWLARNEGIVPRWPWRRALAA